MSTGFAVCLCKKVYIFANLIYINLCLISVQVSASASITYCENSLLRDETWEAFDIRIENIGE